MSWRRFWWFFAVMVSLVSLSVTGARGHWWAFASVAFILLVQLCGKPPE